MAVECYLAIYSKFQSPALRGGFPDLKTCYLCGAQHPSFNPLHYGEGFLTLGREKAEHMLIGFNPLHYGEGFLTVANAEVLAQLSAVSIPCITGRVS